MKLYKQGAEKLTLGNTDYFPDDNGVFTVPDNEVNTKVWGQGFVDAKAHIAQIASNAAATLIEDKAVNEQEKPVVVQKKQNEPPPKPSVA